MKKLLSAVIGVASLLCFETSQAKIVKTTVVHDAAGIPYSLEYIKQNHRETINRITRQQTSYDITLIIFDSVYQDYKNWNLLFQIGGSTTVLDYSTDSSYDTNGTVIGSLPEDVYNIWFTCYNNYGGKTFDVEADWIDANGVQKYKRFTTQASNGDIMFGVPVTNGSYIFIDRWFW